MGALFGDELIVLRKLKSEGIARVAATSMTGQWQHRCGALVQRTGSRTAGGLGKVFCERNFSVKYAENLSPCAVLYTYLLKLLLEYCQARGRACFR